MMRVWSFCLGVLFFGACVNVGMGRSQPARAESLPKIKHEAPKSKFPMVMSWGVGGASLLGSGAVYLLPSGRLSAVTGAQLSDTSSISTGASLDGLAIFFAVLGVASLTLGTQLFFSARARKKRVELEDKLKILEPITHQPFVNAPTTAPP